MISKKKKIVKMGNSLGITIPAAFLEEMKLSLGTDVNLELDKGSITITRCEPIEAQFPLSESEILSLLEKE